MHYAGSFLCKQDFGKGGVEPFEDGDKWVEQEFHRLSISDVIIVGRFVYLRFGWL